jgi:hypothetical protein
METSLFERAQASTLQMGHGYIRGNADVLCFLELHFS